MQQVYEQPRPYGAQSIPEFWHKRLAFQNILKHIQVDKSKLESSVFVQSLCYSSTDVRKNQLPYRENKPGLYSIEYV